MHRYGLPNRPLAGRVNFCANKWDEESAQEARLGGAVDVAVHELTHALFFAPESFGAFINEDLKHAPYAPSPSLRGH